MEFRKYDTARNMNLREPISAGDLPDGWALVGQWSNNVPVVVPDGDFRNPGIEDVNIAPNPELMTFIKNPFRATPYKAGYYLVHIQRFDKIYEPTAGGYWVTLQIDAAELTGVDADQIQDIGVAIGGDDFDICKTNLSAIVYCNGTTDFIQFILSHNYTDDRAFGNPIAENGLTHISIFYIGPRKPVELEVTFAGVATFEATVDIPVGVVSMSPEFDGVATFTAEVNNTITL